VFVITLVGFVAVEVVDVVLFLRELQAAITITANVISIRLVVFIFMIRNVNVPEITLYTTEESLIL